MSDKWCCQLWPTLGNEMANKEGKHLIDLMDKTGLPESVFALQFKLLSGITNACPYCSSVLNKELTPVQQTQHKEALNKAKEQLEEVKPIEKRKCAACAGKGTLGRDKNGVNINCMKCHGAGEFEAKHIAEDGRAKFARTKVDEIREQTGIGDGTLSVDPRGTT